MLLQLPLLSLAEQLRLRHQPPPTAVFDPVRRRWVALTPEEYVRQLLLLHLITVCGYRPSLIAVERNLTIHGRNRRYDLVAYTSSATPYLLVECKAPDVPLSIDTFAQAATYNLALRAPYLLITNGPAAYCCAITDYHTGTYHFMDTLPPAPYKPE